MSRSEPEPEIRYKRVLLKLSGEAFRARRSADASVAKAALAYISRELHALHELGVEAAVVVGGGNLVRGSALEFLDRATADQMGMLATLVNGLALVEALVQARLKARLQSAVSLPWADPIHPRRAREALAAGEIVVFGGGTGNPFVTTDTAAAIRAAEIRAAALLKATQVDGVYTADPKRDPAAERIASLSYERAIRERLGVMDLAALALCQEHKIPVCVFDYTEPGNLTRVVRGEPVGTWVGDASY